MPSYFTYGCVRMCFIIYNYSNTHAYLNESLNVYIVYKIYINLVRLNTTNCACVGYRLRIIYKPAMSDEGFRRRDGYQAKTHRTHMRKG